MGFTIGDVALWIWLHAMSGENQGDHQESRCHNHHLDARLCPQRPLPKRQESKERQAADDRSGMIQSHRNDVRNSQKALPSRRSLQNVGALWTHPAMQQNPKQWSPTKQGHGLCQQLQVAGQRAAIQIVFLRSRVPLLR